LGNILGSIRIKIGVFGRFWCVFPIGNPVMCSSVLWGSPNEQYLTWRDLQNCTSNFAHLGAYGVVSRHSYVFLFMCLTAVLPYKTNGTSFTWIKCGFTILRGKWFENENNLGFLRDLFFLNKVTRIWLDLCNDELRKIMQGIGELTTWFYLENDLTLKNGENEMNLMNFLEITGIMKWW